MPIENADLHFFLFCGFLEFRRKNAGKRAEASKAKELKRRKNDGESSQAKDDGKRQKDASDAEKEDANGNASDD